jgi:TRAP-type C4-dicarboxylate transport system permease small subunit
MKAILGKINAVMDIGANLILINMVAVITMQITMRYIFNSPLKWSEELARYSYAWFCLFGVALVTKEKAHLTVSFIVDHFPPVVRQVIHISSLLIMLFFFVVVSWSTFELPGVQGNIRAYSLGVPFYFLHLSIIPGFIVSAIYTVYHLYTDLQPGKRKGS